jgi:hypothetical protein
VRYLLVALAGALALGLLQAPQETPSGVAAQGVVVDAASRQPVPGAAVLLMRPESLIGAQVVSTDIRGRFAFARVAPGGYRLRGERDGYLRSDLTPLLNLGGQAPPAEVTLTLTPTAVISGRVTDQFGEPISRVAVRAWTTRMAAEAQTNDLGEYRLYGLAPGVYTISAARYPGPAIRGDALQTPTPPCPDCPGEGLSRVPLSGILPAGGFIDPRALTNESYPEVYYPNTTDHGAATPIKAGPGARIEAIDLRLIVG